MAKDPAFLFYSQDWIVGCQILTMQERGQYITILAQMHQQGRMKEETIRLLVGSVSDNLKAKFRFDKEGFWYNERLEKESEKRAKYTESRRENGLLGGRPKKKKRSKTITKPTNNHMDNHMEDENVNENEVVNENVNEIILPFDSEIFKKAWAGWKEYKKSQHRFTFKGKHSEQIALKNLSEISGKNEQTALEIIEQSIANGWKGLFALKSHSNGNKTPQQQFNENYAAFKRG